MRRPGKDATLPAPHRPREAELRPKVLRKTLPALDVSALRVLVVDDNRFAFSLIKRLLTAMRIADIFNCERAEGALAELARIRADLAIVDLDLPGKSGIELIREIRHSQGGVPRELPILVASAHADGEHVFQSRDAGANWVVVKPLSFRSLYDGLVRAILDDRPFIDCPVYVGPCRRTKPRPLRAPAGGRRKEDQPDASADDE